MPVGAVQSHMLLAPISTHMRPATCEEVDCPDFVNGFVLIMDESTELGAMQRTYVRNDRTRQASSIERREDGLTYATFPPGTQPYAGPAHDHVTSLEREPFMLRQPGDHRGLHGQRVVFDRPDQWQEDFAANIDRIATAIERG